MTVSPAKTLALIVVVGAIGILLPLPLLQIALRRTVELTVMICLAVQPILSYLIALPSPAYDWNALVLLGAVLVTAFVGLDIAAQRWGTASKSARLSSVRSQHPEIRGQFISRGIGACDFPRRCDAGSFNSRHTRNRCSRS